MVSMNNEVWLHEKFSGREWFHSVSRDQFGRLVVYVKFMNHETLNDIPLQLDKEHVLVHFMPPKNEVVPQRQEETPIPLVQFKMSEIEELDRDDLEDDLGDLDFLAQELDRLERVCGSNILQDIFYEVHDGKNAITNLSVRFPEVAASMQHLYDTYGFDVVYDELDG